MNGGSRNTKILWYNPHVTLWVGTRVCLMCRLCIMANFRGSFHKQYCGGGIIIEQCIKLLEDDHQAKELILLLVLYYSYI